MSVAPGRPLAAHSGDSVSTVITHWTPTISIQPPTLEPNAPSQTFRNARWRRTPRREAGASCGEAGVRGEAGTREATGVGWEEGTGGDMTGTGVAGGLAESSPCGGGAASVG